MLPLWLVFTSVFCHVSNLAIQRSHCQARLIAECGLSVPVGKVNRKTWFNLKLTQWVWLNIDCLPSEPNSFEKKAGIRVDGYQLGHDFTCLREMMSESEFYHSAQLYGPDVGQPRDHRTDILEGWEATKSNELLELNCMRYNKWYHKCATEVILS